jgi:hypothetical protein
MISLYPPQNSGFRLSTASMGIRRPHIESSGRGNFSAVSTRDFSGSIKSVGGSMVNRLSDLANFLNADSLPPWLKQALVQKQQEILAALEDGRSFELTGPGYQKVTISPKSAAAVA